MDGGIVAKHLPLSRGYFAIVDDEDYAELSQWKWSCDRGYAVRKVKTERGDRLLAMQNQIMQPGDGYMVDHIDGNRCNNQRSNLRVCTRSQNNFNRQMNPNKQNSRYKGVFLDKRAKVKPWWARIRHKGCAYHLGMFTTAEDAARAYNEAALRLHGEFAWLNEIYPSGWSCDQPEG